MTGEERGRKGRGREGGKALDIPFTEAPSHITTHTLLTYHTTHLLSQFGSTSSFQNCTRSDTFSSFFHFFLSASNSFLSASNSEKHASLHLMTLQDTQWHTKYLISHSIHSYIFITQHVIHTYYTIHHTYYTIYHTHYTTYHTYYTIYHTHILLSNSIYSNISVK